MAEIIDFLEYKKRKEEEEIEDLRRQLDDILVFPPEPLPYYSCSTDEPYYTTYDSFYCWPSPQYEKGSYGRASQYDERQYLFSELWPIVEGEDRNEWE